MNSTTWAYQTTAFFVDPLCERKLRSAILMVMMSSIGFFGAAMFTEPAVAKIEEVSCLEHQGKKI